MLDNLKHLVKYYKKYKGLFISDMIFALLAGAATLLIPLVVRYITKTVIYYPISQALRTIFLLGGVMLALIAVEMLGNWYITYYGHVMGAKMEHDMREEVFTHYQKLSFTFFDEQKVGHLLSRITNDLFEITELLHHGPEDIVISIIKIIGALIILLVLNWKLALISLVLVIIMIIFAIFMNKRMKYAFKANRARIADINSSIEDSLAGIRAVKSFGNEDVEIKKFGVGNDAYLDSKRRSYKYMAVYNSGMTMMSSLITVAAVIAGAVFMALDGLTAADLVTFLLYINNFIEPVKRLVNFTETFQNGYSGYERFLEIMAVEPDIADAPDAVNMSSCEGHVSFENVSFHYTGHEDMVLNHVNLDVKAGDYVALVGSSGVGKTTLCSLIPRFYEVSGGAVKLDGTDIRHIKLRDLRRQIGIVQQDIYLFAGTVKDNIRYGRPDATDEEIVAAAKAANAHDFIMELPDGYDTDIGQRGVKLSGGQKQRISIARVFLKDPPVLIFDEATSALDNESERLVQHSLETLAKDRTTFVIAHRLSTVRNARRILVLTENGITEEGTHDELMQKGGAYAALYNLQF